MTDHRQDLIAWLREQKPDRNFCLVIAADCVMTEFIRETIDPEIHITDVTRGIYRRKRRSGEQFGDELSVPWIVPLFDSLLPVEDGNITAGRAAEALENA